MEFLLLSQLIVLLAVSMLALIKGSDILVSGAKNVGIYFGLNSFLVGVLIVGLGTSLPELASSLAAVWQDSTEVVIANVVGSNITNILLVTGILATYGGTLLIKQDLLKSELPLFVIATVHFIAVIHNGVITRPEALLLLGTLGAYFWYLIKSKDEITQQNKLKAEMSKLKAWSFVLGGSLAVILGAHYTIASLIDFADLFNISIGLLSIVIIALGTSLPELSVSLQALKQGEADMVIGNIFGSNAFNILLVASIPALITPIQADYVVMEIGILTLIAASIIFFINGLAKRITQWEGVMMLLFYGFFLYSLLKFI